MTEEQNLVSENHPDWWPRDALPCPTCRKGYRLPPFPTCYLCAHPKGSYWDGDLDESDRRLDEDFGESLNIGDKP